MDKGLTDGSVKKEIGRGKTEVREKTKQSLALEKAAEDGSLFSALTEDKVRPWIQLLT